MVHLWLRGVNRLLPLSLALLLFLVGLVSLWRSEHAHWQLEASSHEAIPPIVHFVQLRRNPDVSAEADEEEEEEEALHFSFEAFLALYAAYHFVQPTTIYIHTDFSPAALAAARAHGSSWTRRVLTAFPADVVRVHFVTAPTHAGAGGGHGDGDGDSDGDGDGLPIVHVEHRADWVRLDQLARFGGLYLDWDVITLRPLAPLRHAGFRAVVGRQFDGFVNNGILLAVPSPGSAPGYAGGGSGLVEVMRHETPRVFDGGWITHSVALLTAVANRLASVPGEVLIMDFKAFAPYEWSQASVDAELARHEGDAAAAAAVLPGLDDEDEDEGASSSSLLYGGGGKGGGGGLMRTKAQRAWEDRTRRPTRDWEYDFSDAYFLHKFYNSVEAPRGFQGVSVPYVLALDSNYAVATWPIVMRGIQEGFIDPNDESL